MIRASSIVVGLTSILACSPIRVPEVHDPSVTPAEFARIQASLLPHYSVFHPEGTGPFATVLFVSGCSGFEHPRAPIHYRRIAERFRTRGRAVVFVDYVRARGVAEACRGVMSPGEVGRYVLASIAYLRTQPFVDRSALDVVGWSLGGGGVLAALTALPENKREPIRFAVALYPDCSGLEPWRVSVPTLLVFAGHDAVQPPERCQRITSPVFPLTRLQIRTYPQAHHGFDMEGLPTDLVPGLPALAYNDSAAASAWTEIARFLGLSQDRH